MSYKIEVKERTNGMLYAFWLEDGKLKRKSLGIKATKPNIAYANREIIPQLQAELAKGKRLFSKTDLRFFTDKVLDRIEREATYKLYRTSIDSFYRFFGDKPIESFKILDIERWIDDLKTKISSATIKVYMAP